MRRLLVVSIATAFALAALVTNAHAARELPEGTVSLVPWDVDAAALASHLGALLAEPARLDALRDAGRAYAATWTFDAVAARVLELVRALP